MDEKVTGWLDLIINTGIEWGNKVFEFFGLYTSKYSKWIVVLVGLYIVSQFINLKAILGGGKR